MPLFSIIVVSYNAESCILATLNSILAQTEADYEIIVKDAISTDRTLDLIPKHSRIRIVSQRDTGIYDGMNQAVAASNGEYLVFMNCGDTFHDASVLRQVRKALEKEKHQPLVLYGDVYSVDTTTRQPGVMSIKILAKNPLCHQSMIFSKRVFETCGNYDTSYHLMADYDLCFRVLQNNIPMKHIDVVVCDYLNDGVSACKKNKQILYREHEQILYRYVPRSVIIKNKIKRTITLVTLRSWIDSAQSPKWLRMMYRSFVGKLKN